MECGGDLPVKKAGQAGRKASKFCCTQCRHKFHARRASRGAILYDLAMTMRKKRRKDGFGNFCHQISLFLQQDREDGRQSFFDYEGEPIPWQTPDADPMVPRKDADAS